MATAKWLCFVVLSLLLAACGGGGGGGGGSPPPPDDDVTQESGLDSRPTNTDCIAPATPGSTPDSLILTDVFPDLPMPDFPMGMYQLPDNNAYFYITTRQGRVLRFDNDPAANTAIEVLDISARVSQLPSPSEGGLLGFAFHPQVASNGAVYIYYTAPGGSGAGLSIIAQFTMTSDAEIDPDSEQIVLQVEQPFGNHNGGDIAFGPDGHLYIGFGDGGSSNDPLGHGQNTDTLLGAMLRIDADPATGSYNIPADNPFAGGGGAGEIYAYGLRNPFRWSFDRESDVLWLADVGQSSREEVNHIVNGGNYGWNQMEGNLCNAGTDCSAFIAPVHDYPRDVGTSITGGYVYRGTEVPGLNGSYVFGDFGSGNIFTLTPEGDTYVRTAVASPASGSIVAFAQDHASEVYVLLAFPGDGRSILKLQPQGTDPPTSNIPALLSETGCVDPDNPDQVSAGLIPFSVISPLWSDGAEKDRWMALPDGETVTVDTNGDFDFPVGTVLVKDFHHTGIMIETRLLMRHQSGWAGYSYKWREDQSDADLLPSAEDDRVAGLNWHFPSGAECRQCHTQVKNVALGPEVLQLNHDFTYPQTGRSANQVDTLEAVGVFSNPVPEHLDDTSMVALDDLGADLELRAKSYLHSNCSQCHQPGGTGEGGMDLRFGTSLAQMNICNVVPQDDLGNPDARFIVPGNPSGSILLTRMQSSVESGHRMPPLATSLVDNEAVSVLTDWVLGMEACP